MNAYGGDSNVVAHGYAKVDATGKIGGEFDGKAEAGAEQTCILRLGCGAEAGTEDAATFDEDGALDSLGVLSGEEGGVHFARCGEALVADEGGFRIAAHAGGAANLHLLERGQGVERIHLPVDAGNCSEAGSEGIDAGKRAIVAEETGGAVDVVVAAGKNAVGPRWRAGSTCSERRVRRRECFRA